MNPRIDREALLDDITADSLPAEFRTGLLQETLRLARQRRRFRQIRRAAASLALLAGLAVWLWRSPSPTSVSQTAGTRTVTVVRSSPLSASERISTRVLAPEHYVATATYTRTVATSAVHPPPRLIDDTELLTLAAPTGAVLVHWDSRSPELVFVPTADREVVLKN
jgi:hypothetical protein